MKSKWNYLPVFSYQTGLSDISLWRIKLILITPKVNWWTRWTIKSHFVIQIQLLNLKQSPPSSLIYQLVMFSSKLVYRLCNYNHIKQCRREGFWRGQFLMQAPQLNDRSASLYFQWHFDARAFCVMYSWDIIQKTLMVNPHLGQQYQSWMQGEKYFPKIDTESQKTFSTHKTVHMTWLWKANFI